MNFSFGESLYLWVGGTKELMTTDADDKQNKMVIYNRYGFIKLAMIHGIDIVPIFQFGEKFVYRKVDKIFPVWIKNVLYNYLWIPSILFFGKFGTLMPFQFRKDGTPIKCGMVMGQPIKVKKMKDSDIKESDLLEVQEVYIERMKFLFETYKHEYFYDKDEKLQFIDSK